MELLTKHGVSTMVMVKEKKTAPVSCQERLGNHTKEKKTNHGSGVS